LETLPNIDINIKYGNSLISRYDLDADIKKALRKSKWTIDAYRVAVMTYRNAQNKVEKRSMEALIKQIKDDFESEVKANDKRLLRLNKLKGELFSLTNQKQLYDQSKAERTIWNKKVEKITREITKLEAELEEIRTNKIYQNAFEWRFEFPEVLDNNGDFIGFDVIIANPPYLNVELINKNVKDYFRANYETFYKRSDIFNLFIDLSISNLTRTGFVTFIVPSIVLNNLSYKPLRVKLLENNWLNKISYTGGHIFEEATVDTVILFMNKQPSKSIELINALDFSNPLKMSVDKSFFRKFDYVISVSGDNISNLIFDKLLNPNNINIEQHFEVFQGIVTGNNPVFIFDDQDKLSTLDIEETLLKPILHGRDFNKWVIKYCERKILYIDPKTDIEFYPKAKKYIEPFKEILSNRRECVNGSIPWYSLQWSRNRDRLDIVPKIIIQNTRNERLKPRIVATLDEVGFYGSQGLNFIVPKTKKYSTHFLLGLINSSLINYLFETKFLNLAIKADYIKQLYFPEPSVKQTATIENIVKDILIVRKGNPEADISLLEKKLDYEVYHLYGLTDEETEIISRSKK